MTDLQLHEPVYRLESLLLQHPQVEMPVDHEFCAGIYARTMHIPAGTILTGAVHRDECFFVVRQGDLVVTTDDKPRYLKAGDQLVSPAWTKRAGVALTDVVVTTYHANPKNIKDPLELWDEYTVSPPMKEIE